VFLEDGELVVVQAAALLEDGARDADLADVVEEGTISGGAEARRGKTDFLADGDGEPADAPAVTA
jgi:hypothetical protein